MAPPTKPSDDASSAETKTQDTTPDAPQAETAPDAPQAETAPDAPQPPSEGGSSKAQNLMARYKALQARAKESSETNLKEATRESRRMGVDPSQQTALQRKHDIAAHKLLKADTEDAGEDFERKRAWDWTVDESEKWDRRVKKKRANQDNVAFQDYTQESNKIYKRQLRNINVDMEKYNKDRMAAIEKSAAAGGLDIVETEDGELIAVDKDGTFYSDANSTNFAQNKPEKAAVDRLVEDIRRAEEQRMKKRKERTGKDGDEGDVTYINEKNKQFNQKLGRFYDKYTRDIRDSFERGTMI